MSSSLESFSRSLWWNESDEARIELPSLDGDLEVDVAIVGGGFTGMSTALHLAEAGLSAAVLEARHIGFGASGRNGGQVIPGLKLDPSDLIAKYGPDRGQKLIELAGGAAEYVFDLIERHAIRCSPVRAGWIQAAHSPIALDAVWKRARAWQARGVPVDMLDRDAIAARTGTGRYFGGWRDPRAGALQPLDYLRGLTRAAIAAGASVFEDSAAISLERKPEGWVVSTSAGRLIARKVVVATNGYTDGLVPKLARSILPVQSMQLATEPLPSFLAEKIMPGGVVLSETRKLAFYMRRTPRGGFMIGGRGAVGNAEDPALMAALEKGMLRLFPALSAVKIIQRWSGHVALSMDGLPHFHEPSPGLHCLVAYNGRGVALSTVFGRMLADEIARAMPAAYPRSVIGPIPWHPIRRPVMGIGIRWYWLKDSLGLASK